MTQKIGALSVDLQAESAAFQRDMRKAQQAVTQATTRMERDLGGVATGLGRLDAAMGAIRGGADRLNAALGGIALGAVALGMANLARQSLDAVGGLGDLAEQAGVSTDALQILTAGAAAAGVSAQTLQSALQKLTRNIGEAGNGNEQLANAFGQLGIGLRTTEGALRPTEQILAEIADRLEATEDPAERARIAVELFGEAGQKLLPVLSRGRAGLVEIEEAARRAGRVIGSDLITSADAAADKVDELVASVTALKNQFVAGLAPQLLEQLGRFERLLDQIRAFGENASFLNVFRLLREVDRATAVTLPGLGGPQPAPDGAGVTTRLQDAQAQLADLERRLADARATGRAGSVTRLEEQIARQRGVVAGLQPSAAPAAAAPTFGAPPPATPAVAILSGVPFGPPAPERERSGGGAQQPQLAAYIEQLRQQAAAQRVEADLVNETASARAAALAILEAESRARQDVERGLRANAALTDTERTAIIAAASARAQNAEAERRANEARQDAARFTEQARTEEEQRAATIERLNELLSQGLITEETRARTIESLGKSAANAWQGFGEIATSAFEDAVMEGEKLRDVVQSLIKDISRLVLRNAVTAPLEGALKGILQPAAASGASAAEAGLASLFGGARATGGPAYAGRIYEVGERGRELFVPPMDGQIIPNHELRAMERGPGGRRGADGGGGAPVIVNFSFTGSARDFGANGQQIAGQLASAVKRGMR